MLDNRLVAPYFPPCHYLAMAGKSFRDRVLAEIKERNISKADLSRRSGVPYHAIDKFLKREGASTNAENARALANVLGLSVDDDQAYEELRELFYQLDEEQRKFLIASVRGLVG